MSAPYAMNGYQNGISVAHLTQYTITALNRWSVANKQLPAVDKIKYLHVYDFDNTLFKSPLPNPKLWKNETIGLLQSQDAFTGGGWWHDSRILAATGEGITKEEARAWDGWWNENVVELVKLSSKQQDVLTVLLTGRSEEGFTQLLKRMIASKEMDFDIICLKPAVGPNKERFSSTLNFKQVFFEVLVETYKHAEEIRIYEDRVKHAKNFRDFFTDYNNRQKGIGGAPTRGSIEAEVVQVADEATTLDPVVETAEVQRLINAHNTAIEKGRKGSRLQIKKTVFYTGYLVNHADTQKLLTLARIPSNLLDGEIKYLANNILITPRPAPNSILEKVGGLGNKLLWQVTGTGVLENKIWAASVQPVPPSAKYYTENPSPIVVLALRKGARPIDAGKIHAWQPVPPEMAHYFETTVGEKVLLRVEPEDPREGEYDSLVATKSNRRKHGREDHDGPSRHSVNQRGTGHGGRGQGGRGSFKGGGSGRGGFRHASGRGGHNAGGGGRHRGRGGGYNYRSLDDVGSASGAQTSNAGFPYDDSMGEQFPAPGRQDAHLAQPGLVDMRGQPRAGPSAWEGPPQSNTMSGPPPQPAVDFARGRMQGELPNQYQQYSQYPPYQANPARTYGGYAPDGNSMHY